MITAKCIDANDYEWLLVKGCTYDVQSWTDTTVVIKHPTCGIYGLNRERFIFTPPEDNVLIDFHDYKTFGIVRLETYRQWLDRIPEEMQTAFKPIVTAMRNWETEVFNYFDHPITNAYTVNYFPENTEEEIRLFVNGFDGIIIRLFGLCGGITTFPNPLL